MLSRKRALAISALSAFSALAAAIAVACNAVTGIAPGSLLTGDAATDDDGPVTESGVGPGETGGPVGVTDGPPATPGIVCAVQPGTTVLVDDRSTADSATPQLISGTWIAKDTADDSVLVLSQAADDDGAFLAYTVSFTQRTVVATRAPGLSPFGVRLLDVAAVGGQSAALASYISGTSVGVPVTGLAVHPLSGAPDGGAAAPFPVTQRAARGAHFYGARFVAPDAQRAEWIGATRGTASIVNFQLLAGSGGAQDAAAPPQVIGASPTTQYELGTAPFFDTAGEVFSFVGGLVPDASAALVSIADTWTADAAVVAVPSVSPLARILGARASTADPSKVAIVAVAADAAATAIRLLAARVPPSQLASLTIGAAPFASTDALTPDDILSSSGTSTSWMDDDLLLTGRPSGGGDGVALLWIGPDGRAVARPSTSGPLVTTTDEVQATAVVGMSHAGETSAKLAVAWIGRAHSASGLQHDTLYAAEVVCGPKPTR
jgi:hypothetical protein